MERTPRYPSDLTDAQWEIIEPMLPLPKWLGRPEKNSRRAIVDAILYVVRTGCSWRQLPADFPPWSTVYWHFTRFEQRGVTDRILTELREQIRIAEGRDPEPTAGIIDSRSVRAADTVGAGSRGYDAGKKINGRKRFIVTDTLGLLVAVWVLAASWQDRDGGKGALLAAYAATPIRHVFADSGFAGRLVDWAKAMLNTTLEIVRKPAGQEGFVVHPRRWVVERSLAWLTAHRRLARDYERIPETSEAMIRWAAINQMLRRITRGEPAVGNNAAPSTHPTDTKLIHPLSLCFNLVSSGASTPATIQRFLVSGGLSLVTGATVNNYVFPAESTPWAGQWSKFHPATPPRTAIPIRAPAAVHAASRLIAYIAGPLSLSPPRPDRAGTPPAVGAGVRPDPVPRSGGRVGSLDRQLAALLWY